MSTRKKTTIMTEADNKKDEETPKDSLLKSILKIEPALVVHMGSSIMMFMVMQNLMLEKACRVNLGYSTEVCDALTARNTNGFEKEEQAVQTLIGTVMMIRTIIENSLPIFLVFLVGAWSDKYGRKLPMMGVIIAFLIQDLGLLLCVYFSNSVGAWTVAIVTSLIPALAGNQAVFFMTSFSLVSDTTPKDQITTRTGILHSFIFLGITLGMGTAAALASTMSFNDIFWIGVWTELFALIYVLVMIPLGTKQNLRNMKGKSMKNLFMDIFDTKHIKDAATAVIKKRPGNTRTKLWALLFSHICVMAPMMGEMGVMFLFCSYAFKWDASSFGAYMTFKTIFGFIGNFVSMGILTQALKLSDPTVGIIACTSSLLSNLLFTLATEHSSYLMYIGVFVSLFAGSLMIVARAIISKNIPSDEIGKINSALGSCDSMIPLLAGPLYSFVYTTTLTTFPGFFFLLSAGLVIPPMLVFTWIIFTEEKKPEKKE